MENSCDHSADIDAYVHGEIHGQKLADFEIHLNSCARCREEVTALSSLRDTLTQSFSVSVDERFTHAVLRDLRGGRKTDSAREIRTAIEDIVISFATLLVLVLLSIQLFSRPKVTSVEMAGKLDQIEQSSLDQTNISNDQVLELVVRNR